MQHATKVALLQEVFSLTLRESRLVCLFYFFLVALILLAGKCAYLQLYKGKALTAAAVRERTVRLPLGNFFRGDILDRQGRSLLDRKVLYKVAVFPTLNSDYSQDKPSRVEPFFLPGTLDQDEAASFPQREMPGIYVVPVLQRCYGEGSLARHLVGCVGGSLLDGEPQKGLTGIEACYDRELSPREPSLNLAVIVDCSGKHLQGTGLRLSGKQGDPARGNDVVLTLDRQVQGTVEEVMDNNAIKGAVAVIDIQTGELRALASRPQYDQNLQQGDQYDRSLSLQHPGSVFKIVVAAAALAEGVVSPAERFSCKGKYSFGEGEEIACWKKDGHGSLSFREAFAMSCNQVFVEVALRLGRQKLEHYSQLLGLEEGIIGFPREDWQGGEVEIGSYPGQLGNAALGQEGVRISPVNLAALVAALARGGVYVKPSLVREIRDAQGKVLRVIEAEQPRRVLPPDIARELQGMMELTIRAGTGKNAQLPGLGSAGKTGSAETGRLDDNGQPVVDAWFAGYAPLDAPQLAIAVFVEGGGSGGGSAAKIFKEIMDTLHQDPVIE